MLVHGKCNKKKMFDVIGIYQTNLIPPLNTNIHSFKYV